MIALLTILPICADPGLQRYQFEQPHMGVPFRIVLYAPDLETADTALERAFQRVAQLNASLSDYGSTSELNRLCRKSPTSQPVRVSDDLWNVLRHAQWLSQQSEGAFDVTVGPYSRLWRRARRQRKMPTEHRLLQAARSVGFRHLQLDDQRQRVALAVANMQLDLGGIAKGYAADQALGVLREAGVPRALVNASGDIAVGDPPPDRAGWRIGVAPLDPGGSPSQFLVLENCGIATSGDLWQFVEIDGKRYSHIIDPRTGIGLTGRSSVTVVAPNCMAADSLASAISVQGPKLGIALTDRCEKTAALVMYRSNEETKIERSSRFRQLPTDLPTSLPSLNEPNAKSDS